MFDYPIHVYLTSDLNPIGISSQVNFSEYEILICHNDTPQKRIVSNVIKKYYLLLIGIRTREVWAVSTFGEEGIGIREHD